jgi:tRNA threonylcarbamoyladenosine biosynthesis protein TsaE
VGHRYSGHVPVSHLDLYRLQAMTEGDWGALEPYFEEAVVFCEWPEAAAGWLPEARAAVRLEHDGGDRRRVVLESPELEVVPGLT